MCWPISMLAADGRKRDARRFVSSLLLLLVPFAASADGLGQALYNQRLADL